MTASPLISVVIPAYNHQDFIIEALQSVLRQDHEELEIVVIDDGSTDGTWEKINTFDDPRILARRQDNIGSQKTINRGLEQARGDYLAILNSDDRFHPQRLSRLLETCRRQGYQMLLTDMRLIDRDGEPIAVDSHWWIKWYQGMKKSYRENGDLARSLLNGNLAITTSNFFFRRDLYRELGEFRPYQFVLDYEYILRAAVHLEGKLGFLVDEQLLDYRLHRGNTILTNPLLSNLETDFLLRRYMPKILGEDVRSGVNYLNRIKRHVVKLDREKRRVAWQSAVDELNAVNQRLTSSNAQLHEANNQLNEVNKSLDRSNQELHRANVQLDADNRTSRDAVETANTEIARLRNSFSFRLGHALMTPARIARRQWDSIRNWNKRHACSVAELEALIQQQLPGKTVVSFDIFDTLLERIVEPPDLIKVTASRSLSRHLFVHHGIDMDIGTLLGKRAEIEGHLRSSRQQENLDHECRFSDQANALVQSLLGRESPELAAWIVDEEIRCEDEVLYFKPGMERLLGRLHAQGLRIIAISDMYLDQSHLETLFARKGLAVFVDRVYVSSESGLGKYSGRLFHHVLGEEGIAPEQMLHVGDNRHSDADMPVSLNISSIWLNDRENNRRRTVLRGYAWLAARNPYWRGRHLLQLITPAEPRDFHYDLGFSYLGPIFCTFLLGVTEKVREHKLRRLCFLAREGDLFLRIFEKLASSLFEPEERPAVSYLYVSRKSTAPAALYQGLSHETTLAPLYHPNQRGLQSICRTFNLSAEELKEVAECHGYRIDQHIDDWNSERYRAMIEDPDFQSVVIRHGTKQRDLLRDYLRQEGFFEHDAVALVDIGWNGSTQRYFQDAFADEPDYPHVHGYYLGWVQGIKHSFDESKNTIHGFMYDVRRGNQLEDAMTRFEELFEESARALHASTIGYERHADGSVKPVFKDETALDRQAELAMNPKIEAFQQGILDFADRFIKIIHLTGYRFDEVHPFMITLTERAVSFPNKEEAEQLMNITHSDDFGFDSVMNLRHDHVHWKYLFRPRQLHQRLRRSNWIYGSGKLLGIPSLNFVLRYLDASRYRQ